MLEKLIKKDNNKAFETLLDEKNIDEKTKNLLQGIIYKIEDSYKDYKNAKVIDRTEKQYIEELTENIRKKCNKIVTIDFNEKIENKDIKSKLDKNKFYLENGSIVTYPIEEKLLYAIEKNSNNKKVVNAKYGLISKPLSNMILTGKTIDRVEVLRDFNGWSWTTLKQEIENVKANLFYQTMQILIGEEFLNNWTLDNDGIIDYYSMLKKEIVQKYGKDIADRFEKIIEKISILNESTENDIFKEEKMQILNGIDEKIQNINNVEEYINGLTEEKKKAEKEIAELQKTLSSEKSIREEYKKTNAELPLEKKIFSVRILKHQLNIKKQDLMEMINKINSDLKPNNYMENKKKMANEKQLLQTIYYTKTERENLYIEFEKIFLDCLKQQIKLANEEELIKLIYKFRYYVLLPFSETTNIKNIKELEEDLIEIEKELLKNAKKKKIVSNNVPFEVWIHIFETRIIELEQLNYEIFAQYDKKYVQLFDENVSEEKYLIQNIEKNKMNKKMKIFI